MLLIPGLILLSCYQSCKTDVGQGGKAIKYFDLKDYFGGESTRLTKLNPMITKTAVNNTNTETKNVHITNWETELGMFTESDINKPAWRSSYNIQSTPDFLIYKAKDPALTTRDIIIKRNGAKIKWILIFNHTKNLLYETEEKLSYFPDSLYVIEKLQKVKLMGIDKYVIRGSFN